MMSRLLTQKKWKLSIATRAASLEIFGRSNLLGIRIREHSEILKKGKKMSNEMRFLLNSILKQDLTSFIHKSFYTVTPGNSYQPNWHICAIAWHLNQCLLGQTKRLIISMPPRSLKSICASVAFPAWAFGHDPTLKIICASYSNELAVKHSRDCRSVMESPWYRKIFPRTRLDPKKNKELEFETTRNGVRYSTSVGGTLTGRGGGIIIIDDPLKPSEAMSDVRRETVKQWFDGTLFSRLDDKSKDVIIVVMQRLHPEDLAGYLLEKGGWVHLNLPAISDTEESVQISNSEHHVRNLGDLLHPEREDQKTLDEIKSIIGTYNYSAQYLQSPIPTEGNLIQWDWFQRYQRLPDRGPDTQIIHSWDTASKAEELNDFSVCTAWLRKESIPSLVETQAAPSRGASCRLP